MLILQTSHTYLPNLDGVAEVVSQTSKRLAARGHEVHVATTAVPGLPKLENIGGVFVHRFDIAGNSFTGIRGATHNFLSFVESLRPEVIALHHCAVWTTDLLVPLMGRMDCGKVFIPHGMARFQDLASYSYFRRLADYLAEFDAIVALSELTDEPRFTSQFGLRDPVIICNGVDPDQFCGPLQSMRSRWQIGNAPWAVMVGNHSPNKGHSRAFEFMQAFGELIPDVKGTLIGNSYPAAKFSLGRLGIKGGCWYQCQIASRFQKNLDLKSDLLRGDVISAIREADIVVVTSTREASPLVVLESMAAGTPWMSFDVGCVREHLGGIVVESVSQMATTAATLINNPDERRDLGLAGKRRIDERHGWDTIVGKYEALFSAASNGSKARHLALRT
jgi:glycosyltransferase involved in cell wall biosynthesis